MPLQPAPSNFRCQGWGESDAFCRHSRFSTAKRCPSPQHSNNKTKAVLGVGGHRPFNFQPREACQASFSLKSHKVLPGMLPAAGAAASGVDTAQQGWRQGAHRQEPPWTCSSSSSPWLPALLVCSSVPPSGSANSGVGGEARTAATLASPACPVRFLPGK